MDRPQCPCEGMASEHRIAATKGPKVPLRSISTPDSS
jgi:hypothetical protein